MSYYEVVKKADRFENKTNISMNRGITFGYSRSLHLSSSQPSVKTESILIHYYNCDTDLLLGYRRNSGT